MTTTQTALKVARRSKYADFEQKFERVPVQYGNLSKRERRCYYLGHIGSVPSQGEIWSFFRICEGEHGEGRFWMLHRILWKQRHYDHAYYTSYAGLPQKIRDAIDGDGQTVWEKLEPIEVWSDAHRARACRDEDFFKMPAEQLVDYINAYERGEPRGDKKEKGEGNILDDVIFNWPWECVDEQATMATNQDLKHDHDAVVVLASRATIAWDRAQWVLKEAKQ